MKQLRTNRAIRSPQVRLIDENEEQIGVIPLAQALQTAKERGFDLVEVSPLAQPPVCKFMDYGNYLYKQKRADRKHRKMQKQTEVKGVRLSIRTDKHDMQVKAKQAEKFLEKKNVVKVALILKGREMAHKDLALDKMDEFAKMLEEKAEIEQMPRLQGYQFTMILNPK